MDKDNEIDRIISSRDLARDDRVHIDPSRFEYAKAKSEDEHDAIRVARMCMLEGMSKQDTVAHMGRLGFGLLISTRVVEDIVGET